MQACQWPNWKRRGKKAARHSKQRLTHFQCTTTQAQQSGRGAFITWWCSLLTCTRKGWEWCTEFVTPIDPELFRRFVISWSKTGAGSSKIRPGDVRLVSGLLFEIIKRSANYWMSRVTHNTPYSPQSIAAVAFWGVSRWVGWNFINIYENCLKVVRECIFIYNF